MIDKLISKYFVPADDGTFLTASEVCQALQRLESRSETPVEFSPLAVGRTLKSFGFVKRIYSHKRFVVQSVWGYPIQLLPQFQTGDDLPF